MGLSKRVLEELQAREQKADGWWNSLSLEVKEQIIEIPIDWYKEQLEDIIISLTRRLELNDSEAQQLQESKETLERLKGVSNE